MSGDAAFRRKMLRNEIHARLINWGRWLRADDTFAKLGLPSKSPFVFDPSGGATIADPDAQEIENVISTLDMAGRAGFGRGELYAFILRVEYAERPEGLQPPVSEKAKDVARRFKQPCSERTYYHHLGKAKECLLKWAPSSLL